MVSYLPMQKYTAQMEGTKSVMNWATGIQGAFGFNFIKV